MSLTSSKSSVRWVGTLVTVGLFVAGVIVLLMVAAPSGTVLSNTPDGTARVNGQLSDLYGAPNGNDSLSVTMDKWQATGITGTIHKTTY